MALRWVELVLVLELELGRSKAQKAGQRAGLTQSLTQTHRLTMVGSRSESCKEVQRYEGGGCGRGRGCKRARLARQGQEARCFVEWGVVQLCTDRRLNEQVQNQFQHSQRQIQLTARSTIRQLPTPTV
jgi:hypothetical protein